jgi:hypothetical protein
MGGIPTLSAIVVHIHTSTINAPERRERIIGILIVVVIHEVILVEVNL